MSGATPVDVAPPDLRGAVQPQIAVSPNQQVHVVFGRGTAIYHVASQDGGKTFGPATKVGELPLLALGLRRGPRIVASDKVVAVSAISHADGNLHCWTSRDGGLTWQQSAQVNDKPGTAKEGLHAMASNGLGTVYLTWLDGRDGGTEIWGAESTDGGATWGANTRVYHSPDGHTCECCAPSAAVDAQGHVAVMFRNWLAGSRDLYTTVSADGGKTFAAAQKQGGGTWKLNSCPMDGGAVLFDKQDALQTVWRRDKTVYLANGSSEQRLADSAAQPVVATGSKGDLDYVWESNGALMMRVGPNGTAAKLADQARFPAIASVPGRGAIVVWQSASSVLAEMVE